MNFLHSLSSIPARVLASDALAVLLTVSVDSGVQPASSTAPIQRLYISDDEVKVIYIEA